jgi:hypothetical protein
MVFVVLVSLSAGSAVFAVLDRPFARDKRHHARISKALLTVSVAALGVAALLAAAMGIADGGP